MPAERPAPRDRNKPAPGGVLVGMRILFATTRGAGHVGPLIPFARAAAAAGHDVLFAGPGSAGRAVRRGGFAFAAVGEPSAAEAERAWAPVWSPETSPGMLVVVQELFIGLHARLALPGMLDVVRTWRPDVVVRETLEFASALAAEREGIPQVRVGIHLDSDTDADPRLLGVATPALDLLRPEIGLEPDPEATAIRDSPVLTLAPASTSGAAEALRFRDAARRRRRRRASCRDVGRPGGPARVRVVRLGGRGLAPLPRRLPARGARAGGASRARAGHHRRAPRPGRARPAAALGPRGALGLPGRGHAARVRDGRPRRLRVDADGARRRRPDRVRAAVRRRPGQREARPGARRRDRRGGPRARRRDAARASPATARRRGPLAGEIAALPPATDAVALLERYASVRRRATATAAPSIAIAPATSAPAS